MIQNLTRNPLARVEGFAHAAWAEGLNDPENGIEAWGTFTGKRLIEAFAGQATIPGNLGHAFGAIDVAKELHPVAGTAIAPLGVFDGGINEHVTVPDFEFIGILSKVPLKDTGCR